MLDIKLIASEPEFVKSKNEARYANIDILPVISREQERKQLINQVEELKRERNELSKKVGLLKKEGKDTADIQNDVRLLGDKIVTLDNKINVTENELKDLLLNIPNIIDDTVPLGKDESANILYRTWGEPRKFDFIPKDHLDIGTSLNIIDSERGVKISKSRFTVLKGYGARLERALINFMMDLHSSRGYEEILPPYLVNTKTMTGTGQLPKFKEDLFYCERDELYLAPTAEVPVTNIHSDEILPHSILPLKYTAYSACFRREAGSYGRDMRGLIRLHQFDKVELVKFTKPEDSMFELEEMLEEAEEVLKQLKIAYRVVTLCSGDIGFSASKTYDIEVWLPGQNCYREISSCSNCKDFQARRANIKYKKEDGKNAFVHTLNGSGIAVGRALVAVLENYQQKDGSVKIPDVLVPYMGGLTAIPAKQAN